MKKLVNNHNPNTDYSLTKEQLKQATHEFWDGIVDHFQNVLDTHGNVNAGMIFRQSAITPGGLGYEIEKIFEQISMDFRGIEGGHYIKKV